MTPITRPAPPEIEASYTNLAEALINAIGGYCSFCEKALNYTAYLFDKRRGVVDRMNTSLTLENWRDLLLICGDCRDSIPSFTLAGPYLWPDSEAAQSLPFRYVKRDNVTYRVVDDNGTVIQSQQRSFVFVEVATGLNPTITQAANNTIQLFQLNKFYNNNPQNPQVVVPYADFVNVTDVRLAQRYRAYQKALEAAGRLERAAATLVINREFVENLLILIKQSIEDTGYISTWETAIKASLDPNILSSIFVPNETPLNPAPEAPPADRKRAYDEIIEDLTEEEEDRPTKRLKRDIWPNSPLVPPVEN